MNKELMCFIHDMGFSWIDCCGHCVNAWIVPNGNIVCKLIEAKVKEMGFNVSGEEYNRKFVSHDNTCENFVPVSTHRR